MLFNSINFIFVFLTAFLISYFLTENKYKNVVIFLYSFAFYIIGNIKTPINIIILILTILLNYVLYSITFNDVKKNVKLMSFAAIIINIILLIIFRLNIFNISSPIGFSFYTLGVITFIVDKYNDSEKVNLSEFFSYILFFPKILSGPIVRFYDYDVDYKNVKISTDNIYDGICLFCIGLAYKCFLSTNVAYIVNQINVYGFESISMLTTWLYAYAYSMELYFDFAGYSMMAIGIAKIIGYNFLENFNVPFAANSISDFWRRWHISLGNFYKNYVYIPLGGNRCGKMRQCINIFVVWLLTGLWHDFKINYIIWAMTICFFIILEKLLLNNIYKKMFIIGKLMVIVIIPITMMIFSIDSIQEIKILLLKLLEFNNIGETTDFIVVINRYWKIIVIGLIFITRIPKLLYYKLKKYKVVMILLCIFMLVVSVYMINVGENDTFKYFAF